MTVCKSDYAQIATYLRGRFRVLNGPEDPPFAPSSSPASGVTREEFTAASTLPDAMTKFFCALDEKVDALLAGLQVSELERDFPHRLEVLSISASCIDFTAPEPLAPGDWLEVVVRFRELGSHTASGIGRITNRKVEKDGVPVFSLEFSRIREEDREKIIRHVFKEERRILRETRLEND